MNTPLTRRPRLTRAQKVSRTRQALLDAAMNIVGQYGHSEASIANITREADVALGTFYMHFESKQALLEELLPWAGQNAHAHMDKAVADARSYAEFEIRNFDALAEFQRMHPFYARLISESEVAAPEAYQQHIERSIHRYRSALAKAHAAGELPQFEADELEVIATMLASIKLLLFTRYAGTKALRPAIRHAYLTFVLNGLFGDAASQYLDPTEPPKSSQRTKKRGEPKTRA